MVSPHLTAGSAPRPALLLTVTPANRLDRQIAGQLLPFALLWLAYTQMYFWLQPRHLTFDGPFMYLFNKPDPGCGLTRTFAWMWRGDLFHAVSVYPLGPLIFVGTILVVFWALAVLLLRQAVHLWLSASQWRVLVVISLVALALNWASKLIWLGM